MHGDVFTFAVTGQLCAFVGAVIGLANAFMGGKSIEELSGQYWDKNPHMTIYLTGQRRLARVSMALIALGFGLQIYATFLSKG
jgi:hypothetical protein